MSEFGFRALTIEDWRNADPSRIIDLDVDDGGLRLAGSSGGYRKEGHFLPDPLDSGIPDCQWHRIVIDADIPENCRLEIKVYASESPNPAVATPLVHTFAEKARDLLIRSGPGRYLNLEIGFHGDGLVTPRLLQARIYYPRLSYLRYLPAIYQDDAPSRDFLERFLSVFESALFASEERISNLPALFDPLAAPDDFLEWLASWIALDRYELLGEKNREFISRAVEFYRMKGTASGLASLVSFLTGRECCVKEYMNNVFRSYGREHYEAEEIKGAGHCQSFYHRRSGTVDTDPQHGMLTNMGGYADRIHYTFDSSADGKHSPHSVGLFIFLKPGETLQINEDELKKIINAFLPVFIQVDITTVESFEESYPPGSATDSYIPYRDAVSDHFGENFKGVSGSFTDYANFLWLTANKLGPAGIWIVNNPKYRTVHSRLGKPSPV